MQNILNVTLNNNLKNLALLSLFPSPKTNKYWIIFYDSNDYK